MLLLEEEKYIIPAEKFFLFTEMINGIFQKEKQRKGKQ